MWGDFLLQLQKRRQTKAQGRFLGSEDVLGKSLSPFWEMLREPPPPSFEKCLDEQFQSGSWLENCVSIVIDWLWGYVGLPPPKQLWDCQKIQVQWQKQETVVCTLDSRGFCHLSGPPSLFSSFSSFPSCLLKATRITGKLRKFRANVFETIRVNAALFWYLGILGGFL